MRIKSFIGREKGKPFIAGDGAEVYELLKDVGPKTKNISIASGVLRPRQKARPHFHKRTEEIYYVLSGPGIIKINDFKELIRAGDTIYIPVGAIHVLENTSRTEELKILAISSPPYSDDDIFFV